MYSLLVMAIAAQNKSITNQIYHRTLHSKYMNTDAQDISNTFSSKIFFYPEYIHLEKPETSASINKYTGTKMSK